MALRWQISTRLKPSGKGQRAGVVQDDSLDWLVRAACPGFSAPDADRIASGESMADFVDEIVAETFPQAVAVFCARSREAYGSNSGLRLGVVLPRGTFLRNRSAVIRGVPVDLSVFGLKALDRVIDHVRTTGNVAAILPAAKGRPIVDKRLIADDIKFRFTEVFHTGPTGPDLAILGRLRYEVSKHLVLFGESKDNNAAIRLALRLNSMLSEMIFSQARCWKLEGQWLISDDPIARELAESATNIVCDFVRYGHRQRLFEFACLILDRSGGPLISGYKRQVEF